MINGDFGYYTLEEVAEKLNLTVYKLVECGANGILKICKAKEIRRILSSNIDKKHAPNPLSASHLNDVLENIYPDGPPLEIDKSYAITKDEFHRFEREYSTETDYPKELQIAIKVWREVFSRGLTPQSPPLSQHNMVRDALKPYKLENSVVERIRNIIVADKSLSNVTEPTTTDHIRNEKGHPHYAPLLEIAIMLWVQQEKLDKYNWSSNEGKDIFTLLNVNPGGGRRKKGD